MTTFEPYPLEQLIDNAYSQLNVSATDTQIMNPIIYFKNKKTFFSNFTVICNKFNRSPETLQKYINDELSCVTSIDNKGTLLMSGRFTLVQLRGCIISYVNSFVNCKQCKSRNTNLIKENRINYIKCDSCFAKTAY